MICLYKMSSSCTKFASNAQEAHLKSGGGGDTQGVDPCPGSQSSETLDTSEGFA